MFCLNNYYFITYQASNRDGSISTWNQVINEPPMKFIKDIEEFEEAHSGNYYNFVVINTCKISRKQFKNYEGKF